MKLILGDSCRIQRPGFFLTQLVLNHNPRVLLVYRTGSPDDYIVADYYWTDMCESLRVAIERIVHEAKPRR